MVEESHVKEADETESKKALKVYKVSSSMARAIRNRIWNKTVQIAMKLAES